jgi:flavin-dependent thymidylate synthase
MKNTVELLGYYGTDLIHAQSAWTSTSRDLSEDKLERVEKLLDMLASEGHHTPFEKSSLHFLVNVDQATHIHLLKHRVGVSINGESARYKELKEDKTYIPEDWSLGHKSSAEDGILKHWAERLEANSYASDLLYHECLKDLSPILGRKRAKESARFFKQMNSQITIDIMFNWRSFAHFLKLRNSEHAQLEVRELAQEMLQIVKDIPGNPFEKTIKAFKL